MSPTEAIAILEGRYGMALPRHRQLCDPAHPDHMPEFVATVIGEARHAGGSWPAAPPPADGRHAGLLARIVACPHRGSSLPVSEQPGCGCRELYLCRAGKGARPGKVTTADCLACVGG